MLNILKILFLFHISYYSHGKNDLVIFAPASLYNGLENTIAKFKEKNDFEIKAVYLGTSSLARQIKLGAKPDIFISANEYWMNHLEDKNLVLENYTFFFLYNDLVLITNENSDIKKPFNTIEEMKAVLVESRKKLSLAMVDSVPAGIYGKKVLMEIGLWDSIKKNTVQTANVRAALNLVVRKELDFGLVYSSDTVLNNKVKVLFNFKNVMKEKIIYPVTILNEKILTLNFYNYLKIEETKNIMTKWGFRIESRD